MHAAARIFRYLDGLISVVAGIALWGMTLVLFVGSVSRYFADVAFVGGAELARYLMVWLTFLGSYLLVRVQRHIVVDLLINAVPPGTRRIMMLIISLVGAVLTGYLAFLGWRLTSLIFGTGQVMSSLPIMRGWIYLSVPVGCGLMCAAYIFDFLARLFDVPLPKPEDFDMSPEIPQESPIVHDAAEAAKG